MSRPVGHWMIRHPGTLVAMAVLRGVIVAVLASMVWTT